MASKTSSKFTTQAAPVLRIVAVAPPSPALSSIRTRARFLTSKCETRHRRHFSSRSAMSPNQGLLYVTVQPSASLPLAQFNDWYNNEHGSLRLRLPFIKSGFRYHATDAHVSSSHGFSSKWPEYMAMYEVSDMSALTTEAYLSLRNDGVQSQRERDIMPHLSLNKKFFDLISTHSSPKYVDLASVSPSVPSKNVLVAVSCFLFPGQSNIDEVNKWYNEEHIEMLSRVPGWLRTTRYVTSSIEGSRKDVEMEYLALHEYEADNGLDGPVFKEVATKWQKRVMSVVVEEKRRRVWEHIYTFGSAPRDLQVLSVPDLIPFSSPDGMTKTSPSAAKNEQVIESYITTQDGAILPYRLEGSPLPSAPILILINSILTTYRMWDSFVSYFLSNPANSHYRILRFNSRGCTSSSGSSVTDITVDTLSSDVISLLDSLRIPKADAVMGVSLGGATSLNVALKYPDRVGAFVACDTSSASPADNDKTWGERIGVAEVDPTSSSGVERIVGEQLAELTVRRWFAPSSYDGGKMEAEIDRVKDMVRNNSLEGFKRSVRALFKYDLRAEMKTYTGNGLFVVGAEDGKLPATMAAMAAELGKDISRKCAVVQAAGHLPMVEKPAEVADIVGKFLGGGQ